MNLNRRHFALAGAAAAIAPNAFAQAAPPGSPDDPRPRSYSLLNQRAADFDFPRLGGGRARLSDYANTTLILYFGGLWCPDCILDGPYVNALARGAAADARLGFLMIHTQNRFGRWGSMEAYLRETGYDYPVALCESRTWAGENYAIEWYPSYLIIRERTIRAWRTDLTATGGAQFLAQARQIAAG